MEKITREEAEYLRSKGRDADIHMSSRTKSSRGKRFYLTLSPKSGKLLRDYREGKGQS